VSLIYKGEDWLNKKIGYYTVVGLGTPVKYESQDCLVTRWRVKCDCGTEKQISKWHIVYGNVTGCENCVKDRIRFEESHNWNSEAKNVTGMYYGKIKAAAKKRKIQFKITREEMDEIFQKQNGKCLYTNMDLFFETSGKKGNASLDRINSSLGYIKENVQWVHKKVNIIKWDLTHEEFVNFCKTVTENYNGV
jgi:hypothetical protein